MVFGFLLWEALSVIFVDGGSESALSELFVLFLDFSFLRLGFLSDGIEDEEILQPEDPFQFFLG